MSKLSKVTANTIGKTRQETMNGVDYLVAPVRMIVPGVLNGSQGAGLYTEEETSKNPSAWNGMPLVVYHPTRNGKGVSARDPEVLQNSGVGFVFNAKFEDNLDAEAWFDIAATERIDSRIMTSLNNNEPIELSTGLFTENVPADEGATFNGAAYTFLATNQQPDHLAILPDQIGACSLDGGCGVLINKSCECKDKEDCKCLVLHEGVEKWLTTNEMSHSDLRDLLNQELASNYTQDQPGVWVSEVFDSYIVYWQGEHLYKLGYTKSQGSVSLSSEDPQKVIRETSFVVANEEKTHVANKQLVDQLVSNCSCWTEEDKTTLNGMSDEKLKVLIEASDKSSKMEATVKDTLTNGIKLDDKTIVFNSDTKAWEEKKEDTKPAPPVANERKSLDNWMAEAPPELVAVMNRAIQGEAEQKKAAIEAITANLEGDEKAAKQKLLANRTFEQVMEIKEFAVLAAPAKQEPTANTSASTFFAANTGASAASGTKIEPLQLPTMNFGSEDGE